MRRILTVIAVLVLTGVVGVDAQAAPLCRTVAGRFVVDVTTVDCASPVGMCTRGAITGAKPLNGTTSAVLTATAAGAGMPGVAPSMLSYTSTWQLTTPHGTAVFSDIGIFDTAGGRTTSISTLVSGTGRLAGATGVVYLNGTGTTHLDAEIRGQICLSGAGDA
ncbi:hypothetical protein [Pseudonocardia sp. GCM10023141]|uniref:hypothetical protein n=1 Tax=Pseudonocardia sp. GCM10023141 TaxID=3252653 RepID=UPI00361F7F47